MIHVQVKHREWRFWVEILCGKHLAVFDSGAEHDEPTWTHEVLGPEQRKAWQRSREIAYLMRMAQAITFHESWRFPGSGASQAELERIAYNCAGIHYDKLCREDARVAP